MMQKNNLDRMKGENDMDKKDDFATYYSQEFNMLENAHFQTSQKIISFFQYALLIFSAPIALLVAEKMSQRVLGLTFVVIGFIEVLVIAYLSSLRSEALLYARQINRIRNVLYTKGILGETIEEINKQKILFSQDKKPNYNDMSQFFYIVLVLGFLSAFYTSFGVYKLIRIFTNFSCIQGILSISLGCGILMLIISFLIYRCICIYNENGTNYYKRIIGVDIDGVLNKHEETFVKIFNEQNSNGEDSIQISADQIITLPVHESGIIDREREQRVFKTVDYWEKQVLTDDAKQYLIEEIRNKLGFKPYIFTWRHWKVKETLTGKNTCFCMKRHTKKWLRKNKIKFKKIFFEKGNVDRPISLWSAKYKTRYYYAQKYRIRYFVEDNYDNAEKLSHICEYVFLVDHAYNQTKDMPYNIIRVSDWKEIHSWIKKLS